MSFTQIFTNNRILQLIQSNISNALSPVFSSPFIGGVLLQNQSLQNGSNTIQHNLGRTPRVWILCDLNAAATIYRTAWNTSTISLTSNAAATVALWVN